MTTDSAKPDTIVLIHGFWVTPRSWEHWIAHYESQGYRVLAPGYPGFEVEVEALNADPTPIERVTVPAIIEHLEAVVGGLDSPPILIGHSAGGVFTQILLDHGFGAAGVAINSAPTEGVKRGARCRRSRRRFPGAQEPGQPPPGRGLHLRAVELRLHQHLQPRSESRELYERYHVPASGSIFWEQRAAPTSTPGHQGTWVDYNNDDRAPAAVHLGQRRPPDAAVDPAVQRQALQRRTPSPRSRSSRAPTCSPRATGWEEVADYALDWAEGHRAREGRPHHAHRRADGARSRSAAGGS